MRKQYCCLTFQIHGIPLTRVANLEVGDTNIKFSVASSENEASLETGIVTMDKILSFDLLENVINSVYY